MMSVNKKSPMEKEPFYWGASTAAHQVEGNSYNDWSEWEKAQANQLASQFRQRMREEGKYNGTNPDWGQFKVEAADPQNYISAQATDHYIRYPQDFALAKKLGHNAHRFSLEWSRIQPTPVEFSPEAINHYRQVLKELRRQGLEPFVTLWHFSSPVWFARMGGWSSAKSVSFFVNYVEKVIRELGDYANFWITINEPMVYLGTVHAKGMWLDLPSSKRHYVQAFYHMVRAHNKGYKVIKKYQPRAQVGIAKNCIHCQPADRGVRLINKFTSSTGNLLWNHTFSSFIKKYTDFVGINYYLRLCMSGLRIHNPNEKVSDLGWELYPKGLYHVVREMRQGDKPIYILEHGLADAEDKYRGWYIEESLKWLKRAREEGAPIQGYFHWSLLDNFEWDKGFWPRFGLIEVDYPTQKRKVRPSANTLTTQVKKHFSSS